VCLRFVRGQIDVMRYLAEEAKLQPSMRVLFLTPCHATPYYSHVHSNITMDFLDCSPPGEHCNDLPSFQIMPKTPDPFITGEQQTGWSNKGCVCKDSQLAFVEAVLCILSQRCAQRLYSITSALCML